MHSSEGGIRGLKQAQFGDINFNIVLRQVTHLRTPDSSVTGSGLKLGRNFYRKGFPVLITTLRVVRISFVSIFSVPSFVRSIG